MEAPLRIHPSVSTELVGEELLLVQTEQGTAFVLNKTARLMWNLISAGCTAPEVINRLRQRFDVPGKRLEDDVSELIRQLKECEILRAEPDGFAVNR